MEPLDILVVDDNDLIRKGIASVLNHAGYRVVETTTAKGALQMLAQRRITPRVIISDYRMPEMNGAEFAVAVRAIAGFKTTPVLMVSSEINPHCKEEARKAGVVAWIAKSAISRELLPAVREQMNIA